MEQVLRKEVALNWEREAGGQGRTGHRGAGGEEWAALGWGGSTNHSSALKSLTSTSPVFSLMTGDKASSTVASAPFLYK